MSRKVPGGVLPSGGCNTNTRPACSTTNNRASPACVMYTGAVTALVTDRALTLASARRCQQIPAQQTSSQTPKQRLYTEWAVRQLFHAPATLELQSTALLWHAAECPICQLRPQP